MDRGFGKSKFRVEGDAAREGVRQALRWGFPEIKGTFCGVPIEGSNFLGSILVFSVLGHYHLSYNLNS